MRLLLCLLMLSCCIAALAQPDVQAQKTQQQILEGYLARLDQNMTLGGNPAEEGFVAQGRQTLPVMQEISRDLSIKLAAAEGEGRQEEILRLRFQLQFLDRVMVRLQTDMNPPALIRQWVREQYRPEDQYIADILPEPVRLTDPQLGNAFPGYLFYVSRFPHYPVAREIPPPLSLNNLFAVRQIPVVTVGFGATQHPFAEDVPVITLMTDSEGLRKFFLAHWAPGNIAGNPENLLMNAAFAWLRLSEELHNDGFFRFTIPANSLQVTLGDPRAGRYRVTGRADVLPTDGNSGSITATLVFSEQYALWDVLEEVRLQPGPRPGG